MTSRAGELHSHEGRREHHCVCPAPPGTVQTQPTHPSVEPPMQGTEAAPLI